MERLTTNKEKSEMGMYELAHNSCYCKDGVARYRDYENDIDARDLARELAWSLTDIELSRDNECFDEEMLENLQYDITKEPIGLIALFYRNLWAMADLREKLKEYEDLEEQGLLLRLPCKIGDTIWDNDFGRTVGFEVTGFSFGDMNEDYCDDEVKVFNQIIVYYKNSNGSITGSFAVSEIGKTVFLTQEEAEQKLKGMESD